MSRKISVIFSLLLVLALSLPGLVQALPAEGGEPLEVKRISGKDRYETAVAISDEVYDKVETVILASGGEDNYPDALAASALAEKLAAPILLTNGKKLSPSTKAQLKELETKKIIVLGGSSAISKEVFEELEKDYEVRRIEGKNRYETAAKIALELDSDTGHAFIALGSSFADALSIGPVAAREASPILLTRTNELMEETIKALEELQIDSLTIIGGRGAISPLVEVQLRLFVDELDRISGSDRYETSLKIAEDYYKDLSEVILASGKTFPDALAGSYLAAFKKTPILLVEDKKIPANIKTYLEGQALCQASILGGHKAVAKEVEEELRTLKKPARLEIKTIDLADDKLSLSVKFEGQKEAYIYKLDEALTSGQHEFNFIYLCHEYELLVVYDGNKLINKSSLNEKVKRAKEAKEEDWSQEDLVELESALLAGQAALDKEDASQEEVDAATKALEEVLKELGEELFKVSFETSGGSELAPLRLEAGSLITKPEDPIKEGYYLLGWYKDQELSKAWDFEKDKAEADLSLYAQWEKTPSLTKSGDSELEISPGDWGASSTLTLKRADLNKWQELGDYQFKLEGSWPTRDFNDTERLEKVQLKSQGDKLNISATKAVGIFVRREFDLKLGKKVGQDIKEIGQFKISIEVTSPLDGMGDTDTKITILGLD